MFRKSPVGLAIAALISAPVGVHAELEISAEFKNELAVFTSDGQVIGEANSMLDTAGHERGDVLKAETSLRLFINGEFGEESSWHAELRPVYDDLGVNDDYTGHQLYTQNDYLRELYIDTSALGWDWRLGKQQVVWGTADGIKLLDIVNPTDFREFNQNAFEDSRIPIWMINAERYFDNGGNLQLIVAQNEENKFPGLNENGDAGHPFTVQGVDAITGQVNGFVNITPNLASVAQTFTNGAPLLAGVFNTRFPGLGLPAGAGLVPFAGFTVDGFTQQRFYITPTGAGGTIVPTDFGTLRVDPNPVAPPSPGAGEIPVEGEQLLNFFAQCGFDTTCSGGDPNGNVFTTNLMPVTGASPFATQWNPNADRTSAFEHLPLATFATFNTFAGNIVFADLGFGVQPAGVPGTSAGTRYLRDYPDSEEVNFGGRYRGSLDNGLNFSFNYFYGYDKNPAVDLSWHDRTTGEELEVVRAGTQANGSIDPVNDNRSRAAIIGGLAAGSTTSVLLRNNAGQYYGSVDPTTGAVNTNTNSVDLYFTERVYRTHNIGTSFDYALDVADTPVVVRGEFLYTMDSKQPVIDNLLLGIGDLSNGLVMEDADIFKYVLGVDVTVFTNLLISGQLIQFRNLDYVDQSQTCNVLYFADPANPGTSPTFNVPYDCSRYTGDFATLNPSNGLNKGSKNEEFFSLFFSKPFGDNQLGRWNNITIYEEGGGYWNRFDLEYSLSDELIVGGEINSYWGEKDTLFGQFRESSNLQVSLKVLIE